MVNCCFYFGKPRLGILSCFYEEQKLREINWFSKLKFTAFLPHEIKRRCLEPKRCVRISWKTRGHGAACGGQDLLLPVPRGNGSGWGICVAAELSPRGLGWTLPRLRGRGELAAMGARGSLGLCLQHWYPILAMIPQSQHWYQTLSTGTHPQLWSTTASTDTHPLWRSCLGAELDLCWPHALDFISPKYITGLSPELLLAPGGHRSQTAGNSSQSWCSVSHVLWLGGWTAQFLLSSLSSVLADGSGAGARGEDALSPHPRCCRWCGQGSHSAIPKGTRGELRPWPQAWWLTGIAVDFPIQISSLTLAQSLMSLALLSMPELLLS